MSCFVFSHGFFGEKMDEARKSFTLKIQGWENLICLAAVHWSVIRQKTPFRKMSILWWPHDSPVRPSHFGRRTQEFYTCSLLSCQPWLVGIKVDNSKENRHKILEFIFQNGMVQQVNQVCLERIWSFDDMYHWCGDQKFKYAPWIISKTASRSASRPAS